MQGRDLARPARMPELEALRTISFAAVVLQHILGAYAARPGLRQAEGLVLALVFGLCKFAVPMFLFVSGAVLFRNYYGRLQYGALLKKRLASIVLPYLIWAALYFLWSWLMNGVPPCGKREFLLRVLTGRVSYHTWYVMLILQFYLLLPLIFALMRGLIRLARGKWGAALVIGAVAVVYGLLVTFAQIWQPIPVLGRLLYDLRAQNFLYYLVYFLLGGLLALYPDAFLRFVRRFAPLAAVVAVLGYGYSEWWLLRNGFSGGVPDFNWMGSLSVPMFLFTTASILLLYRGALGVRGWLQRACTFVGRHSYSAYLAHVLVLSTLSQWLLAAKSLTYPAFYLLLTALTLLASLLLAWGVDSVYDGVRARLRRGKKTGS